MEKQIEIIFVELVLSWFSQDTFPNKKVWSQPSAQKLEPPGSKKFQDKFRAKLSV